MPQARRTDGQLLAAYLGGEAAAFEELYRRYGRLVYAVCLRRLGDPGEAEDAAAAAFLVLVRKARGLARRRSLAGWLQCCAVNTSKKAAHLREKRLAREKEAAEMRLKLRDSDRPAWNAALPHLDAALAALPVAQRDVVVLQYMQGRPRSQVAKELALPMGTVAKRARLGIEKLRRRLAGRAAAIGGAVLAAGLAESGASPALPAGLAAKITGLAGGEALAGNAGAIAGGTAKAMTFAKLKIAAALLVGVSTVAGGGGIAAKKLLAAEPKLPDKLKSAPANEWVKIYEGKTGGRMSPVWYYDPQVKKFVLTGGANSWPLHWDNEEFDLASLKFINAYPQGIPADQCTPAEGPSKYPHMPRRGYRPCTLWRKDKNGLLRIPTFAGYGDSSQAYHQYAYDPEGKRVVLYCRNKTMAYDPKTRKWTDTGAGAFSKGSAMHWGSMCYDPVNKEIVSIGGSSFEPGGTPGTWAFKCAASKWEKLKTGSDALRKLNVDARTVMREAWDLLSALRNRFYMTEDTAEAKAKLGERGKALTTSLDKLLAALKGAKVDENEKAGLKRATDKVTAVLAAVKGLQSKFDSKVDSPILAAMQKVHMQLDAAEHNLDFEPAARAMSQMAYDAKNKVIVLFGGSGLDRQYADTWVYHCAKRHWEQRWPKKSPSPRAGHALLWLPRSKTVWLGGGYTLYSGRSYMYGDAYWHLPWEAWTYDAKSNEWKCIFHVPLPKIGRGYGPGFRNPPRGWPWGSPKNIWTMTAGKDDTVLFLRRIGRRGPRDLWAMKADVSKASAALAAKHGVPPETLTFRGDEVQPRVNRASYDPGFYDRVGKPDRTATEALYKKLPANQWIHINPPKGVDMCGWGTSAWDSDREQWLFWGGGHSEYKGTNVFHYATRTGLWSASCRPELPLEWSGGFLVRIETSFRDRPHIPVHAYQTYAYDPPSGTVLFAKWSHLYVYELTKREFDPKPYKLPFPNKGVMRISLETTPKGVIAWNQAGELWRYEKKAWKKLPYNGPKLGAPWCDGTGLVYDPERDCLWISGDTKRGIVKYDIKSGTCVKLDVKFPKAVGKWPLWREPLVIPGTNLIMPMQNYKAPDGKYKNLAVDVVEKKYYWIDMPYLSKGKPFKGRRGRPAPNFRVTSAMHWDARRKLVWIHNPISFWVLKFDKNSAKMEEVKD